MRKRYRWEQGNRPFIPQIWQDLLIQGIQSQLKAAVEVGEMEEAWRIERLREKNYGFFNSEGERE